MTRLAGKVTVVTGAASGMGRATARLFAAEGAAVLLADLDAAGGEAVTAELTAAGGTASFRRVDVSHSEDVQGMVRAAVEAYGALHVLYNNAGIEAEAARIVKASEENWARVLAVNLTSVFLGIKYGMPLIAEAGGGNIINTASAAALIGTAGTGAYTASKTGVVGLTRVAAIEGARWRVRVNAICPGPTRTSMFERYLSQGGSIERLQRMAPWPDLGTPEDIAELALFLASDASRFVTGAALPIDGGQTAW